MSQIQSVEKRPIPIRAETDADSDSDNVRDHLEIFAALEPLVSTEGKATLILITEMLFAAFEEKKTKVVAEEVAKARLEEANLLRDEAFKYVPDAYSPPWESGLLHQIAARCHELERIQAVLSQPAEPPRLREAA